MFTVAPTGAVLEQRRVRGADSPDEAVGGGVLDQVVERPTAALRGDHEGAVLDERAVVDEVGEVLAGRASPALPTPCHRRRSARVEPSFVAFDDIGEVGARHRLPVLAGRLGRDGSVLAVAVTVGDGHDGLVEHEQAVTDEDRRAHGGQHLVDRARCRCEHFMVHLHRLDQGEYVAPLHRGAPLDEHPDDRALQLRCHRNSHPTGLADGPGHSPRSDRR